MGDRVPTNSAIPAASGGCAAASVPTSPQRLELTSEPAAVVTVRHAVESFAAAAGLDSEATAELGLSANEAVANVIRHAYGGQAGKPIVVTLDCDCELPGRGGADCPTLAVRVTIRDWGNGINPATSPPRERDPLTPGGLGLICLRELMDTVVYTPQPDGMLLTLVKRKKC